MRPSRFVTVLIVTTSIVFAPHDSGWAAFGATKTTPIEASDATARARIGARSQRVMRALQHNNTRALARWVHPLRGLSVSPYVFSSPRDRRFNRAQTAQLRSDKTTYWWGDYDGSGEAMRLRWNRFRQRFLVLPARANSPKTQIFFNRFVHRGNTSNNLRTRFPNALFVEYHRPATTKDGSDWRSLWMVWQPHGADWFLVALAGDQWTI